MIVFLVCLVNWVFPVQSVQMSWIWMWQKFHSGRQKLIFYLLYPWLTLAGTSVLHWQCICVPTLARGLTCASFRNVAKDLAIAVLSPGIGKSSVWLFEMCILLGLLDDAHILESGLIDVHLTSARKALFAKQCWQNTWGMITAATASARIFSGHRSWKNAGIRCNGRKKTVYRHMQQTVRAPTALRLTWHDYRHRRQISWPMAARRRRRRNSLRHSHHWILTGLILLGRRRSTNNNCPARSPFPLSTTYMNQSMIIYCPVLQTFSNEKNHTK